MIKEQIRVLNANNPITFQAKPVISVIIPVYNAMVHSKLNVQNVFHTIITMLTTEDVMSVIQTVNNVAVLIIIVLHATHHIIFQTTNAIHVTQPVSNVMTGAIRIAPNALLEETM